MTENLVMLTVRGRFRGVTGGFTGVASDTRSWRFAAAVLADSIDTGFRWRDALVRSRHVLNASRYPIIAFDQGRIEGDVWGVMRVRGDLTLCGVTREVALLASYEGRSADLQRGDRLHYSATGRIDTHRRVQRTGAHDASTRRHHGRYKRLADVRGGTRAPSSRSRSNKDASRAASDYGRQLGPKEKQHDVHPSPYRCPWNIRSRSSPAPRPGSVMRLPALLAEEGWREIIVTGRSLSRAQETAARLAAETKTQAFTPLGLDLNAPTSVQSAVAERWSSGVSKSISCCSMQGWSLSKKKRVLTAAGVEASQAPLIGHHQLTVRVAPRQPAADASQRADCHRRCGASQRRRCPCLKYTDLSATFASKYHRGDRTAAVEALISQRAEREVRCQLLGVCRREAHHRLVGRGAGTAIPATLKRHGRVRCLRPVARPPPRRCEALSARC